MELYHHAANKSQIIFEQFLTASHASCHNNKNWFLHNAPALLFEISLSLQPLTADTCILSIYGFPIIYNSTIGPFFYLTRRLLHIRFAPCVFNCPLLRYIYNSKNGEIYYEI